MRAIPKNYSGVLFRSTLEADWAFNLDSMGMRWQYEPEGIIMSTKDYYRPDLYLPLLSTHIEVKGPHDERIHKPHQLAADTLHAPGCKAGAPIEICDRQYDGCACKFGPAYPWRMVVILRPATNGVMVIEGVGCPEHPRPKVRVAKCGECESYSFTDLTGIWRCRRCLMSGPRSIGENLPFTQIDHKAGQHRRKRPPAKK